MNEFVRKLNSIIHTSCVELFYFNLLNSCHGKMFVWLTSSDFLPPLFTSSMNLFRSPPAGSKGSSPVLFSV